MKKLLQIKSFLCTLLLMQMFTVLQAQNPVGAIPGVIDVSPMGAASYTIPIEAVPGTQGMQPNLSIVYNSFGGMGLLGMKWNLTGLSAITRCGQTPYYDNNMTAIQFNRSDRFALDGNRLLQLSPGAYGLIGGEYATELENFTRVISYGGANYHDHFIAYTDDGSIIEYGNNSTSKQKLGTDNSSILSWCINKVTDANGNYMTFEYVEYDHEILIDKIYYTGNTAAGIHPYAKVEFAYRDLPDTLGRNTYFVGGYGISQTKLLETIKVYYDNSIVRKYEFVYNTEDFGERTAHLKEIVLYGEDETQQLNPTIIYWGAQNIGYDETYACVSNTLPDCKGKVLSGDFNGDGYNDLLVYQVLYENLGRPDESAMYGKQWQLFLYNPLTNNYYEETSAFDNTFRYNALYAHDVNGDGKDELIMDVFLPNGNELKILSLPSKTQIGATLSDFYSFDFGDFDGNGTTDIVLQTIEKTNPFTSKIKIKKIENNMIVNMSEPIDGVLGVVFDANGNGKKNVQVYNDGICSIYEYNGTNFQSIFQQHLSLPSNSGYTLYYGDFNGDGITDIAAFCKGKTGSASTMRIYFSKGNGYFEEYLLDNNIFDFNYSIGDKPTYPFIVADLNGDGKDDIIQVMNDLKHCHNPSGYSSFNILFSKGWINGNYIYNQKEIIVSDLANPWDDVSISNYNQAGKCDLIIKSYEPYHASVAKVYYINDNDYELVKKIEDGVGKTIKLNYKHKPFMAESSYFNSSFPARNQKYFLSLVDSLKISNGIGYDFNTFQYQYDNAVYSLPRKTFSGFKAFVSMNHQDNKRNEFLLAVDASKQILKPAYQRSFLGNIKTSEKEYIISLESVSVYPRFALWYRLIREYDRLSNTSKWTDNLIDSDGRLIESMTKTFPGLNPYSNDWALFEKKNYTYETIFLNGNQKKTVPTRILTTQQYGINSAVIADTLTCGYYPASEKGRLAWMRKGNVHGVITTLYGNYSATGVYQEKTVSAGNHSRKEMYEYDDTRRFVMLIQNSDFQEFKTYFNYNPKTGDKTSETDINGLKTTYQYDSLGNLTQINYPDGTKTNISVKRHTASYPPNAKYYTTATTSGKPALEVYYDVLGREVCRQTDGYYYQTVYNNKGQVEKTSGPFQRFNEPDIIWHEYTYDIYGRKKTEKAPYINLSYAYSNRKVTVTDNLRGVSSFKDYDALGRITKANDPGGDIDYGYEVTANKQHKTTIGTNGATTTIFSDLWGNRLSINEPNAGLITSAYNGFNELVKQMDACGNATNYQYDKLGRVTQKQFTATGATPLTFTYIYDNAAGKGKGKLSQIKMDGAEAEAEAFAYDNCSRLSTHRKVIDGTSYAHKYSYTDNGQLKTLTYPDNFAVTYKYSSTGKLDEIRQTNNDSLIYRVLGRNKYHSPIHCEYGNRVATYYKYDTTGQVTRIQTGNVQGALNIYESNDRGDSFELSAGNELSYSVDSAVLNYRYGYDSKGLMVSRSESVMDRMELYGYDNLDRLAQITSGVIGQAGTPQTFCYYDNGNILRNPHAGDYTYGSQPHAVSKIEPISQGVIPTHPCAVDYNFFNQPTQITEEDYRLELFYGADRQRAIAKRYKNNVLENTCYYVSKYSEYQVNATNATHCYDYIYGDHGIVAMRVLTPVSNKMYYIHTDHLGSYCAITNAGRQVVQNNRFDPWGNTIGIESFTYGNRGFTGHEHYPYFKVINMNGRLYDPVIARFFSPDTYVQDPGFTQAYNRYSYALNNPLRYVDRTGERYEDYDDYDDEQYDNDGPKNHNPLEFLVDAGILQEVWDYRDDYNGPSSREENDSRYNPNDDYEPFDMDGMDGPDVYPTAPIVPNREPYNTFWRTVKYIWTGGVENGVRYNYDGTVAGIAPVGGTPPVPAFKGGSFLKVAKVGKALQTGKHTLNSSTLKALNLTQEQGKKAIEALKKSEGVLPNQHGTIMPNGDYFFNNKLIGNLFDYLF